MTETKKFYITTPIYYPSGKWHLGHCYTTVYGDAIARFKRLDGYDVFYLTGTDEHGQKIEKRASEANTAPKEFVDELVTDIKRLWKLMNISYDKFIRTTDDYHVAAIQKIFKKLYEQGDIYKSKYKGKYCTPCESFWTESQLKEGKCPDCGRDVIDAEEVSYFFKLSKFESRIRELLTKTDFLQPASRVNEMINNFVNAGLDDIAVSRTSFKWGIPVDFDPGHVVYVWIDALNNYITALGYEQENTSLMEKYWPADLHLMAKEIVRFHSIIWPAILMALNLPLPKHVVGHGWLLFDGDKMSKSKGNVVDPFILAERYGVDSLRYYLLRAMPFGADGSYTNETFITRLNTDLANDLGNLVKRSMAMATQYFGGKVDNSGTSGEFDAPFIAAISDLLEKVRADIDKAMPGKALESIFDVIGLANKYIDNTKPWILNKNEQDKPQLMSVIYNLLECIRVSATVLMPFMPETAEKIISGLELPAPKNFDEAAFGYVKVHKVTELGVLFPRLDTAKELIELESIALKVSGGEGESEKADKNVNTAANCAEKTDIKTNVTVADTKKTEKADKNASAATNCAEKTEITIDEFFKTQLKVAEVIACEKVEKADKLLKLTVKVGEEIRTVVSGIAKSYTPEEMVGKRVVLVANLKPAVLRGITSQGMILCATHGDKVALVSPEKLVESGSEVC